MIKSKLPIYTHHSGARYIVLSVGNQTTTDKAKWPTLVTYVSCNTGEVFTREYDVFIEKFEEVVV